MSTTTQTSADLLKLLLQQLADRTSGVLTAVKGKHRRIFCIRRTFIIYVASNVIEEQFERFLVASGDLDTPTLQAATEQAKLSGLKVTAYLKQQNVPPLDRLKQQMDAHVRTLLEDTLAWGKGARFQFEAGRPDLSQEPTGELSMIEWFYERCRAWPLMNEVKAGVGPVAARPQIDEETPKRLAKHSMPGLIDFFIREADGRKSTEELLRISPAPEEETLRGLYALMRMGLMFSSATAQVGVQGTKPVTREECENRLTQARDADHYMVLGVARDSALDPIREAYYFLARRFHPDHFRSGLMQDLLPQIEEYFSKVTEAYNTLSNSVLRADYDSMLAGDRSKSEEPKKDGAYLARENFARAKLLIDRGQYRDAVQFLENAIELDRKAIYMVELGRILIRNPRQRAEALDHLTQAIALDPTNPAAHTALAELYLRQERGEAARDALMQALHWDASYEEAHKLLEQLDKSDGAAKKEGGLFKGLFRG